jgi:hypothetical protein
MSWIDAFANLGKGAGVALLVFVITAVVSDLLRSHGHGHDKLDPSPSSLDIPTHRAGS